MKKFIAGFAVGATMLAGAGQALAYFEDLHLIRSIYTSTGQKEVGSDLGLGLSTTALTPYNVTWPGQPNPAGTSTGVTALTPDYRGDLVSLSDFDAGLPTLRVAYWAHDAANRDFYATGFLTTGYGGTDGDGLGLLGLKQNTADATYNTTQNFYNTGATATTVVKDRLTLGSYWKTFEKGAETSVGSMNANLTAQSFEMTLSLAALQTNGYVDQLLYYFDYNGSQSTKQGVEVAVIRTFLTSDGTTIDLNGTKIATVINPSAVPIPAAGWLLGSGLLALIGIRRRNG